MSKRPAVTLSWRQFERDIKTLAHKIGKNKFKYILAISRGGLVPAAYLARLLDIKVVKTICLQSYENQARNEIVSHNVEGFEEYIRDPKSWLVVDDICDSGATFKYVTTRYPQIKTASILCRPAAPKPTYHVRDENNWVRFPWEHFKE